MCLSTAYMISGNEQKEIMKDIARIEAEGQGFWLINLFEEKKFVEGSIQSADLLDGRFVLVGNSDTLYRQRPTMEEVILEIDDRTFDLQVLKSDKPVLVDLWAPWCGPCNSIEPVVEKLAEAYGDQIRFTRCNVDQNPKTPDKYGIKGIPTLMFFRGGKLVDKLTGLVPRSTIEDAIMKCLSGSELVEAA